MGNNVNQITLIGRLGADAELKQTNGGPMLRLRIATSEDWRDKSGEKKEVTFWHTAVLYGDRAEKLAPYLRKGALVYVQGRSEPKTYETKDGAKGFSCDVNVKEVRFLDSKRDAAGDAPRGNGKPAGPPDFGREPGGDDSDLPF